MNGNPEKERALDRLKAEIELSFPGGKPVTGEGDPDASLVVVGEAPGRDEEITGHPFAGKAGRLLDE
ncbi:MAG: uracil-DNA glycosylase, partial [Dehalococcoidia bacterium]|nr:uracil-DNA glycosylase [Dehalococcoidia bacterium]